MRTGEVDESVIATVDPCKHTPETEHYDHVARTLLLADRVGALGAIRDYPDDIPPPDSAERKAQLTRLAAAGVTVPTNAGQVLPLDRGRSVALIGRHALETIDMGGGSAQVNPPYQVSVAEGLTTLLGDAVTVTDGVEVRSRPVPARPGFVTDPETGAPGVHFTLLAADGFQVTGLAGTDDRGGDHRVVQHPGQRDLGHRGTPQHNQHHRYRDG